MSVCVHVYLLSSDALVASLLSFFPFPPDFLKPLSENAFNKTTQSKIKLYAHLLTLQNGKGGEFCTYPKSGNLLLAFPAASLDSSEIKKIIISECKHRQTSDGQANMD